MFGILGYAMKKLDYPAAPLILALMLGDRLESDLRRSLVLSGGSPAIFLERPITLVLLLAAVGLTWLSLTRWSRRKEVAAVAEAD